MNKTTKKSETPSKKGNISADISMRAEKMRKAAVAFFFVAVWGVLSFYENATLFRISDQSQFLLSEVFFNEMISAPAGLLSYAASFLVQFFHYPALGAAIYVSMLLAVYLLTRKVFDIPGRYSLLALFPVAALLASNTQLGYWIFYLKVPGYYYMALLAVLAILSALWLYKRLGAGWRIPFALAWLAVGYPVLGVYALAGAVLMAVMTIADVDGVKGNKWLHKAAVIAVVAGIFAVPYIYYHIYTTVALKNAYMVGLPYSQWIFEYVKKVEHESFSYWHWIYLYWIPFILLMLSFMALPFAGKVKRRLPALGSAVGVNVVSLLLVALLLSVFWYNDTNFRIENKQNKAMWNEEWRKVADYAAEADVPTRQIVMNKNLALLKLGVAGNEMFNYPDGSSEILSPMIVHLTQTGGKMTYFQYAKFNFCYRWCVEDAVEYGWRNEYLKHAARSMLLSGEYKLAQRYLNILKGTLFYRGWAEELETFIEKPELIAKEKEFYLPLQMTCYSDALDVDESFVEVFLTKNFSYIPENASPLYIETALTSAMIRKDMKAFWFAFDKYLRVCNPKKLPKHYQEAVLLFMNLDKSNTVTIGDAFMERCISSSNQRRLASFVGKTKQYKGMDEAEMAQYFDDYDDTYFYFYFFVRKIKTN